MDTRTAARIGALAGDILTTILGGANLTTDTLGGVIITTITAHTITTDVTTDITTIRRSTAITQAIITALPVAPMLIGTIPTDITPRLTAEVLTTVTILTV